MFNCLSYGAVMICLRLLCVFAITVSIRVQCVHTNFLGQLAMCLCMSEVYVDMIVLRCSMAVICCSCDCVMPF